MSYETVPAAAGVLKCCTGVIYRKIREGKIPAIRIGRSVRVDLEAVAQALKVVPREESRV